MVLKSHKADNKRSNFFSISYGLYRTVQWKYDPGRDGEIIKVVSVRPGFSRVVLNYSHGTISPVNNQDHVHSPQRGKSRSLANTFASLHVHEFKQDVSLG